MWSGKGGLDMSLYITPDGGHGYTTRSEWGELFDAYSHTIRSLNRSSDALLKTDAPLEDWIRKYRALSSRTRVIYLQAERLLKRHIRYFTDDPSRWAPEVAAPLLDYLFRYVTRLEDMECVYLAASSMLCYYRQMDDEVAQMKCYAVQAVCYTYLDSVHFSRDVWHACDLGISLYEKHFQALTPEEQSMGLSLYDAFFDILAVNMALSSASKDELLSKAIDCYRSAAHHRDLVLLNDRDYLFNRTLPPFEANLAAFAICVSPGDCTAEQARTLQRAAVQSLSGVHCPVSAPLSHMMAQRLTGGCQEEDILDYVRVTLNTPPPDPDSTGFFRNASPDALEHIYLTVETLLGRDPDPPEFYYQVLDLFLDYFSRLPFSSYLNYVSSSYIYCYIRRSLGRLYGREDLLSALLKLAVFRQPQTAVHSIMVGKLSVAIMGTLVREQPQLLVGLLGAGDTAAVQAKADEFCDFIYTSALLHDLGKILCPNVVNTQYRQITQLGYRAIQYHAATGGRLLRLLPGLSYYADIAEGHHKSYNGAFGYPDSFDNTASPLRMFIDIITICDSLDAATDTLGRNYAEPKDFETVLRELDVAGNTRYSRTLVDLIQSNGSLRDQLVRLLAHGRSETYYEVHDMIQNHDSGKTPAGVTP